MAEQPWLPATWDRQADVAVVGFGAAGAATAITAYEAGAKVILLDKAPLGARRWEHARGRPGLSQHVIGRESHHLSARAYVGPYRVPDPMVQVWAEEMGQNNALGSRALVATRKSTSINPWVSSFLSCLDQTVCISSTMGLWWDIRTPGRCWRGLSSPETIEILYETPGKALIQHGVTKDILGVRAERDGKPCYIGGHPGVWS